MSSLLAKSMPVILTSVPTTPSSGSSVISAWITVNSSTAFMSSEPFIVT
jgi:hypothetical protein